MTRYLILGLLSIAILPACKKDKQTVATLTTAAVSNVSASGAQTGGAISSDGGAPVQKRGIAWATHTQPTVADSITNDGSGPGNFSTVLANLNANTTYYIRAYASNAAGTAYGNELSFKTTAGVASISTTAVTDIQPLSAKAGGNISNDGGAPVTERGLVYASTPNPTLSSSRIVSGAGSGSFIATLSPLASQQTYYVRAYAINSYGTSYGNQLQFNAASANTVTDIDGNVYSYVTIGAQSWMTTNLKTTKYRNGDAITNGYATPAFDWLNTTQGAYSFPAAQPAKKDTFGLLYNLYAVRDPRGVCPAGWHVPGDEEWKALEMNQGMSQVDADNTGFRGTIAAKLKEGGSSGLNLQLSGYLFPVDGSHFDYGVKGFYYTSSNFNTATNWYRSVYVNGDLNQNAVRRTTNSYGMSVRCVKD